MLRILSAFVWLRWRVLMNTLERTGSRDVVERLSGAVEQLGPILVLLVMVPSLVLLAGGGAYAGWSLGAGGGAPIVIGVLQVLLFAASALAIIAPVLLPTASGSNPVRLLLLPIPRGVLYLSQMAGLLADPWLLLPLTATVTLPLGLLVAGAPAAAGAALVAAVALAAVLFGLALLVTAAVQLVARNRRRGELLALLFVLIVPALGVLPEVLASGRHSARTREHAASQHERRAPAWLATINRVVQTALPSEMYARTIRSAAGADGAVAARNLAGLAFAALALHAVAFTMFRRVLDSPGASVRAGSGTASLAGWRVPGVSAATSAVALNQLRLALRTPRGRSTILSPFVVFAMFSAMMLRSRGEAELSFFAMRSGLGLAAFSSFVAMVSILPLAMNQFAIDKAGLTLAMLAPLETRALLFGKAIGNALIVLPAVTLCAAGAFMLFPGGHPGFWLALPLAIAATYALVAPAAAALSAVFPRAVDLNSIGRGSNAHAAAGLLGMASFVLSAAPSLLLVLFAGRGLQRPFMAPLLVLAWLGIALPISGVLFRVVAAIFERRRENVLIVS